MNRALPSRILVPVTFDSASRDALIVARDLAHRSNARLCVLHVWNAPYAETEIGPDEALREPNNLIDLARHECAQEMRRFLASANLADGEPALEWAIHSGPAGHSSGTAREIVDYSRAHDCDWIVMGTHRQRGLTHWLMGSVAEEVLTHAPCPVLVVPAARTEPSDSELLDSSNKSGDGQ